MEHDDQNLYNILITIKGEIGEMKSDIKSTLVQALKTNGHVIDLEKRTNTLEAFMNTWKGKIAIIGLLLGFIGTVVGDYFRAYLK